MLVHPQFDPVAIQIGPVAVHWYGLMYLIGFALVWLLGRWRINHGKTDLTLRDLEDLIFYCVLGVVIGGRLGYALFYKPSEYLANPIELLYVRSEEHTSELQSLMRISYAVFCLKKTKDKHLIHYT